MCWGIGDRGWGKVMTWVWSGIGLLSLIGCVCPRTRGYEGVGMRFVQLSEWLCGGSLGLGVFRDGGAHSSASIDDGIDAGAAQIVDDCGSVV